MGEILAGDGREYTYEEHSALRIMTGGRIPEGYDAVIRQEDTNYLTTTDDTVEIYAECKPYSNYCKVGEDLSLGTVVCKKNQWISPMHIGLLASIGIATVKVKKVPRIAIISTGTEITPVGKTLEPGKIYNSIAYQLHASCLEHGLMVTTVTSCVDDVDEVSKAIREASKNADVIITTGAVSVGKKDILPAVLEQIGSKVVFRRANIQPGTPTIGSIYEGKPVLSLSGNPYAAYAHFELYLWKIVDALLESSHYAPCRTTAVLMDEYTKKNRGRRLVRAYYEEGKVYLPTNQHESSVISNMLYCNCFIDFPKGSEPKVGDEVTIQMFA